jgi:general secretion pathway protein G
VLIVITLVIVLASVGMPVYQNSVRRSREAVLKEDLFRMRDAIDQYYADKNKYPQSLQDLVSEGYLREIPKDPITDSADTWTTVPAEPDPANATAEPGVYDVKSGSDATALNGSKYADWE